MNLPQAFLSRMKQRLGDFPAFLQSYGEPVRRGLRVNTLKISTEEFLRISPFSLTPVAWEKSGFYVTDEKIGAHAFHFAGLYYSQEPSAMCAVPMLDIREGERVLDLCAAPGGKTTQIAQYLNGTGLLVANEYVPARAKILSQNLERLGVRNAVVVNADVHTLAERFPVYFDKILVDAPCSGEGMFKKEPNAIPEWSEEAVALCAARQREITDAAAKMLRGGGKLVYSTCTFAEEEDEWQAEEFVRRNPGFRIAQMHKIYPHREEGEGHFAVCFQKDGEEQREKKPFSMSTEKKAESAFSAFAKEFFYNGCDFSRITVLPDGRMYALPEGLPDLSGLRILRAGIELGEWDGKLFKPAHALAMAFGRKEVKRFVPLSEGAADRYLRGETAECGADNGWCTVGVGDFPIGLGKAVNGTVKNHIPKGLRKVK